MKRYGRQSNRWPSKQIFMHPWQFAAAFMSLRSKDAENLAQVALSSASLLLTLMQLEGGKYLRKAKKVSPSV